MRIQIGTTTIDAHVIQSTTAGMLVRAWPGCPHDWIDELGRVWLPDELTGRTQSSAVYARAAQLRTQGLTRAEIAERMGVSEGVVKRAIDNAQKRGWRV